MSLNKVMLIGNLGKDPELRFTPSGRAVARFSVATSEQWTDQQGQRQDRTEWHNVVVWGKQAETCGQYLSKGRQVFIEGSVRSRKYDDKEGRRLHHRDHRAARAVPRRRPRRRRGSGHAARPAAEAVARMHRRRRRGRRHPVLSGPRPVRTRVDPRSRSVW
jgi:single-strand DNA-binding protein